MNPTKSSHKKDLWIILKNIKRVVFIFLNVLIAFFIINKVTVWYELNKAKDIWNQQIRNPGVRPQTSITSTHLLPAIFIYLLFIHSPCLHRVITIPSTLLPET